MVKAAKIDDVKRPDRVLPSATSRPILVTDQGTSPAADPMLSNSDDAGRPVAGEPDNPAALSHTAKPIKPLAADSPEPAEEKPDPEEGLLKSSVPEPGAAGDEGAEKPVEELPAHPVTKPTESETEAKASFSSSTIADTEVVRDPEAEETAAETAAAEAKARRDNELEDIIASGKYAVPINAVQRRRSRVHTIVLCSLAVLLALALLDAVCDVGLISVPDGVPHTHFFSR